jgi:uncharacterized membrane protein (UPF0127 family)
MFLSWHHKGFLLLLLTMSLCAATMQTTLAAEPAFFLREFKQTRLIINTKDRGCVLFDVYVAQTNAQRSQGLMNIESMGRYEGMIFIYAQEAEISMWMKNTLIPLDMLFIGRDRRITHIHENAVPMSEDIIESGSAVVAVLELNGGAADSFAISPEDRIIFPAG